MYMGYLGHVIDIFQRIGFRVWVNQSEPPDWHVLWAHEYPFSQRFNLSPLKSYQKVSKTHLNSLTKFPFWSKVNHFPGSGFITNKVNLATSGLKHIPKAFNVPREKEEFLKYVSLWCLYDLRYSFCIWFWFRPKNTQKSFGFRKITTTVEFGC